MRVSAATILAALTLASVPRGGGAETIGTEEKLRLACMAWKLDRTFISMIMSKHRDAPEALGRVAPTSPTAPLARSLADNLRQMDRITERSQTATGEVYQATCSP